MNTTRIEWTERTWNPVTGCTPVSEGCTNCWARRMAHRLRGRFGYPKDEPFRVTLHPDRLREPLWLKKPARIFVASMGDLFHPEVPYEYIDQVFAIMALCPQHTFQVLTKRPERMLTYLNPESRGTESEVAGRIDHLLREGGVPERAWKAVKAEWANGESWIENWIECEFPWPLPNVWAGVTCENQPAADERIPILLQTPAAVRFVSCEPLLSAIDLSHWLTCACDEYWPGQGHHPECPTQNLHWCIVGGETGPNARPMHPDWVRSLRDQAVAAGVPFFFKSWGDYVPGEVLEYFGNKPGWCRYQNGTLSPNWDHYWGDGTVSLRVGRTTAGRLLDGREWNEYPQGSTSDSASEAQKAH